MSWLDRLFRRESKASEARKLISISKLGQPVFTPRNYESFSKEAFQKNVVAFRAISGIAKSCGGIPWCLKDKKRKMEIEEHPLLTLLRRPNPMQGQSAFIESVMAYFAISGNSYMEAVGPKPGQAPTELWALRPDRMKLVPGVTGLPASFIYTVGGMSKTWQVDQISGKSAVLHMKTFNPVDDWYGMSPIEAAVYAVDQHNESGKWNLSLLQNSATPSGALMVKVDSSNPAGVLTDPQFERLKQEVEQSFQGARNAGRPMVLEGNMEWEQMSFSPTDMDWLNSKATSARDIALVFGYPALLLGLPGDNTYANYKEARMALYEDTIIPLMDGLRDELNNWLTPAFGDNLALDYDRDDIEALAPKREAKWKQVSDASFLTVNEKRESLGYAPLEGGDKLLVASSLVPIESVGEMPEDETDPTDPAGDPVEDDVEDVDIEDIVDDEGDPEEDPGKSFKQINLVTRHEKVSTWKRMNSRRAGFESSMSKSVEKFFNEEATKLADVVKASNNPRLAEFAVLTQLQKNAPELKSILKKHIKDAIESFGGNILNGGKSIAPDIELKKAKRKFDQFVLDYIEKRAASSVSQIESTSAKKARKIIRDVLSEGLQDGETNAAIASNLEESFSGLSKSRATTIARTEVASASNQGSLEAAKTLDVPGLKKEWVSVDDDRTRGNGPHDGADDPNHAKMDGVRVDLNEKFNVPPDVTMDAPGDSSAPADQVINCRCVLVYSRA